MSFQDLYGLTADICADESTLCMALLQLQKDKQVIVSMHEGEKVNRNLFSPLKKKKKLPEASCGSDACPHMFLADC